MAEVEKDYKVKCEISVIMKCTHNNKIKAEIKALYICDPNKNTQCEKTECIENGGCCKCTTNIDYAKHFDLYE